MCIWFNFHTFSFSLVYSALKPAKKETKEKKGAGSYSIPGSP